VHVATKSRAGARRRRSADCRRSWRGGRKDQRAAPARLRVSSAPSTTSTGTVGTLKKQFKAVDHEIAEVMMVASVAAAVTKLRKIFRWAYAWWPLSYTSPHLHKPAQRRAVLEGAQAFSLGERPEVHRGRCDPPAWREI
jgi:hypothetical protein